MKKNFLVLFASLAVLSACNNQETDAGNASTAFYVGGNCEKCEARIEAAAKSVTGVTTADWDVKTDMMEAKYDSTKTTQLKIEQAIAAIGHTTEHVQRDEKAYEKLPDCCKDEAKGH